MCVNQSAKSLICELASNIIVNADTFILQFFWPGPAPKAGQFFMLKPCISGVFLGRPLSVFQYDSVEKKLKFLVAKKGKGTEELFFLREGDKVRLTGPLGNGWEDIIPSVVMEKENPIALISGSVGVAPLAALVYEKQDFNFHFFAGFKNGFNDKNEENLFFGSAINAKKLLLAAEDGKNALNGLIIDYLFEPEKYNAILACGSAGLLKAVKKKCEEKNVSCFLSMESRMACGVGACLGCTIKTVNGNRRCCADGPIFNSKEVIFND